MSAYKKFTDGFASKMGEGLATWIWPALIIIGGIVWAWLRGSVQLSLTRSELLIAVVAALLLLIAVYWIGYIVAKRRFAPKPQLVNVQPIDGLEREILLLLWTQYHNVVPYWKMLKVTQSHPSLLRYAGEKLQQRGYIGFSYVDEDSNMALLTDGREYVVKNKLHLQAEPSMIDKLKRLDD